jgi:ribosomal protein S24E
LVENVKDVEIRDVVAKVLAAAANAVLVAQRHYQLGTHMTSVLARLQVYNLARKSSLEVGSTREKKGAEEGKCKHSVWQFGPGTRKCR